MCLKHYLGQSPKKGCTGDGSDLIDSVFLNSRLVFLITACLLLNVLLLDVFQQIEHDGSVCDLPYSYA